MPELNDSDDLRATLVAELEKASSPETDGAPPAPEPVEAPTDQAAADQAAADQRARDERGRFATKDGTATPEKPVQAAPAQTAEVTPEAGKDAPATPGAPPPGWSPAAKAAWHEGKIPPEVQKDIAVRESQIAQGFAKLADYKGLDQYVDLAKQNGTTVVKALDSYIKAEQTLEKNPVEGILWLCKTYGVDPAKLVGSPAPAANGPAPAQGQGPDLSPILTPIQQELAQLREMVFGEKQTQTSTQVTAFFSDPKNRYADNVAEQMAQLIATKQAKDLPDAYEKACWLNPEVRAEIIREQNEKSSAAAAAKAKEVATAAKRAGRSINGAPSTGQVPSNEHPDDLRAMLEQQFAAGGRA